MTARSPHRRRAAIPAERARFSVGQRPTRREYKETSPPRARPMTASSLHSVVRCLSQMPAELSDAELLDRFGRGGEDAAFALLVQRHGPGVLGVCRRLLGNAADADDAFQATFLVLLRKSGSVRHRSALGCWLYGVACRV